MNPIEEFLNSLNDRKLSPVTIRGYVCDVRQFLTWVNHNELSLDQITHVQAEAYLNFLVTSKHEIRPGTWGDYSPTTVRRKILSVRKFFDARESGHE